VITSPRPTHAALATTAAVWPAILRRTATAPLTAVQGDAHLLDWEGWSIEPGPHDLASLIALHPPVRERQALEQELVERYAVRPRERGVAGYNQAACWDDYRRAIARPVLSPAGVWSPGTPARAWWPVLEQIIAAYHEPCCEEVLWARDRTIAARLCPLCSRPVSKPSREARTLRTC